MTPKGVVGIFLSGTEGNGVDDAFAAAVVLNGLDVGALGTAGNGVEEDLAKGLEGIFVAVADVLKGLDASLGTAGNGVEVVLAANGLDGSFAVVAAAVLVLNGPDDDDDDLGTVAGKGLVVVVVDLFWNGFSAVAAFGTEGKGVDGALAKRFVSLLLLLFVVVFAADC